MLESFTAAGLLLPSMVTEVYKPLSVTLHGDVRHQYLMGPFPLPLPLPSGPTCNPSTRSLRQYYFGLVILYPLSHSEVSH